jgi:hypothetical protein
VSVDRWPSSSLTTLVRVQGAPRLVMRRASSAPVMPRAERVARTQLAMFDVIVVGSDTAA